MPSNINPGEIDYYVKRLRSLGADSINLSTDDARNELCHVTWVPNISVVGIGLTGQIGAAFEDAERKLRAAVAQAHPTVELPDLDG